MATRLIRIDGLPGSGKSTLATSIADALGARVLLETDPHHPLHPVPVDEMGAAWADVHERMSPEAFAAGGLARWEPFPEELAVVESYPFQSMMRVLHQMNADRSLVDSSWSRFQAAVAHRSPRLVYLRSDDPTAQLDRIADARGPVWRGYLEQAFERTAFGQTRRLQGWDAVREFISSYHPLIEELVERAEIPVLILPAEPVDYDRRLTDALSGL